MAKERKPDFEKLRHRADDLVKAHAARNTLYTAMRRMLYMEWAEQPGESYIKPTLSPDPHNAIIGIVRLLVSQEPQISVAYDDNDPGSKEEADKLEKALGAIWNRANRARRWPLHYDAILSAVTFSEVAIRISNLADVIEFADAQGKDAGELKRIAKLTPFVYDVVDPSTVFPQFGAFGLRSVLHRYNRPAWEVREFWGKAAEDVGVNSRGELDENSQVEYSEWWDSEWRCVWTKDQAKPILQERHGLPFIPWVCAVVMGTGLFAEAERQRIPLLYPVYKGNWWQRENLMLTQLYTVSSLMMNPTWQLVTLDDRPIEVDLSQPGGQIRLRPQESIAPLQKQLIDPSVTQALTQAQQKIQASTLPQVVFGQAPVGGASAYSALNLLSQGGRLPLVPIQQQVGNALSEMFEKTLRWIEHNGKAVKLYSRGRLAELKPSEINPDHIEVEVKLTADVPQDMVAQANAASMLVNTKSADGRPLVSRETALGMIGKMQPGEEEEKILQETFVAEHLKEFVAEEAKRSGQETLIPPPEVAPPMLPAGPEMGMSGVEGQGFNPAMGGAPPVMGQPPMPPEGMMPGGFNG